MPDTSLDNSRLSISGGGERPSTVNPWNGQTNATVGQTPHFDKHIPSTTRSNEHIKARPSGKTRKNAAKGDINSIAALQSERRSSAIAPAVAGEDSVRIAQADIQNNVILTQDRSPPSKRKKSRSHSISKSEKAKSTLKVNSTSASTSSSVRSKFHDSTAGASYVEAHGSSPTVSTVWDKYNLPGTTETPPAKKIEHDYQVSSAIAKPRTVFQKPRRTLPQLRPRSVSMKKGFDDAHRAYEKGVQHYTATLKNTAATRQEQTNAYFLYTTASYKWEIRKTNVINVDKKEALDTELRRATERLVARRSALANVQIQLDDLNQKFPEHAGITKLVDPGVNCSGDSNATTSEDWCGPSATYTTSLTAATAAAEDKITADPVEGSVNGDNAKLAPEEIHQMVEHVRGRLHDAVKLATESVRLAWQEEEEARTAMIDIYSWARRSGVSDSYSSREARGDFSRATAEVNRCFHNYKVAEVAATLANTRLLQAERIMKRREVVKNTVKEEGDAVLGFSHSLPTTTPAVVAAVPTKRARSLEVEAIAENEGRIKRRKRK